MSHSEDSHDARRLADPLIGKTLGDNYLIEDILGEGGMAVVYKAKQLSTQRPVAIKTLKTREPEFSQRFAREMRTHAKLHHKNIVEAIDCFETAENAFFVMEQLKGVTLFDRLKSVGRIEDPEKIYSILVQTLAALEHAHQFHIVHRDLKSPNVFILNTADDETHVKVLDFGIAKVQDDMQKLTGQGQALGSPLYMSPEQCMGHNVTNRSDLYTMGILAYEMITGHLPYEFPRLSLVMAAHCDPNKRPQPISEHRPDLNNVEVLDQIIMRAIESDPDYRFQKAEEFTAALDHWIQTVRTRVKLPLPKELVAAKLTRTTTQKTKQARAKKSTEEKAKERPVAAQRASGAQIDQEEAIRNFLLGLAACCVIIMSAVAAFFFRDNLKRAFVSASMALSGAIAPATQSQPGSVTTGSGQQPQTPKSQEENGEEEQATEEAAHQESELTELEKRRQYRRALREEQQKKLMHSRETRHF